MSTVANSHSSQVAPCRGRHMVLDAVQHRMHGEALVLPVNVTLGALAAFVAWGRWTKAPIAARASVR